MINIHPSDRLELFCILLKLYTTKFQGERSSLRRAPQKQEKLAQEPGMKMLTGVRDVIPGFLEGNCEIVRDKEIIDGFR